MFAHMYAENKSRAHACRYSPSAPTVAGAESRFMARKGRGGNWGEEGRREGYGGVGCGYDFIILKLRAQPG